MNKLLISTFLVIAFGLVAYCFNSFNGKESSLDIGKNDSVLSQKKDINTIEPEIAATTIANYPDKNSTTPKAATIRNLKRRDRLNLDLKNSTNLSDFVRDNLKSAEDGDSEAQLAISNALFMCEQWEARQPAPESEARNTKRARLSAEARLLYARKERQCDGVSNDAKDNNWTATGWLEKAAENGNGVALYRLATQDVNKSSIDDRLNQLKRSIESQDPEVLAYIVDTAFQNGEISESDLKNSPDIVFAAIEISKCNLGLDCSADGAEFILGCDESECTRADGVVDRLEKIFRPAEMEAAKSYSEVLVNNFLENSQNWREEKFVEQSIKDKK